MELWYITEAARQKNQERGELFSKWTPKVIIQMEKVEIESLSSIDEQQFGTTLFLKNFLKQTEV